MNYTRRDLSMYIKFNTINMNGKKFQARRLDRKKRKSFSCSKIFSVINIRHQILKKSKDLDRIFRLP